MSEPTAATVDQGVRHRMQEGARDVSTATHSSTPFDRVDGLGSWLITADQRASPAAKKGAFGPFEPPIHEHSTSSPDGPAGSGPILAAVRRHSLLALTLEYTQQLHFKMGKTLSTDESDVITLIESVFTPRRMRKLELRGFKVEDVACWGWILASDTVETAISRFHTLREPVTRETTVAPLSNMPYFMFTLLLRSRHISAPSLDLLVQALKLRLSDENTSVSSALPDAVTTMILLFRLVRHAGRVAPGQMIAIASLSERLLKAEFTYNATSPVIRQRLCYNYNRMLSFLSIPTSQHPFRSIPIQQQAQFRIIRQMASMEPALLVNREGFRALVKIQLAHKKTADEIEWARTKADSWPPWREDKLGISVDVEYPGSQSRAADVLRRQIEAGYMQTGWDLSARILAGWDTDNSPTVQKRSILPKAPLTWFQSLRQRVERLNSDNKADSEMNSDVWAARIRATRTIREAWACFCAYDAACSDERSQDPYYAMFLKLASGHSQARSDIVRQLPGDGREVYPQPNSAKDHLFVSVEPPTFYGLYKKSRVDGIKPAGRLLALLLDHARTNREGIEFVYTSKLSEDKRDVLLNAHKYDEQVVRSTLKSIQPTIVASYFSMLCRTGGRHNKWYKPSSHAVGHRSVEPLEVISAQSYVLDHLRIVDFEPHVYNKVFETIFLNLRSKKDSASLDDTRTLINRVLDCMKIWNIEPDMATFYSVTSSIEYMMDANHDFTFELLPYPSSDRQESEKRSQIFNGPQLAKTLFIDSVVSGKVSDRRGKRFFQRRARGHEVRGGSPNQWLPYSPDAKINEAPSPADLHLLMRLLAKNNDVLSMVTLLRWMDRFATELNAVRYELANGHRQMRFALCVAAMAIEDYDGAHDEDGKVFLTALKLVNKNPAWGGWPRDEELERYLVGGQRNREAGSSVLE